MMLCVCVREKERVYHRVIRQNCIYRSSENVPLKSNEDGSYVASWVPSTSGNYIIQVFIDGKTAGVSRIHT